MACTRATARGKLQDRFGSMLAQLFLQAGELLGVRAGRFVVVAHVRVDDTCARLNGGEGAFDLLCDCCGHSWVVRFGRDRASDGAAENAGFGH